MAQWGLGLGFGFGFGFGFGLGLGLGLGFRVTSEQGEVMHPAYGPGVVVQSVVALGSHHLPDNKVTLCRYTYVRVCQSKGFGFGFGYSSYCADVLAR